MAACKKSSDNPATPNGPAASTQWTYNNASFTGEPAQWTYDTTGMLGYLSTIDTTGANGLEIAFAVSGPLARPDPGKYYFVNSNGTNIPSGVQLNQICFMAAGPATNVATSIGGTLNDTATVTFNAADKMVVYFSNIMVTGGIKVSGTLVE